MECPLCIRNNMYIHKQPEICDSCINSYNMYNEQGNPIVFGHISESGGFFCKDLITNLMYFDCHICYVNGLKCFVDDDNFRKITVSIIEK